MHINYSHMDDVSRMVRMCPNEKRRRRMFGWFQNWYGWNITCLGCGEQWADGEWLERPFKPRWRQENIDHAKKLWNTAKAENRDGASKPEVGGK